MRDTYNSVRIFASADNKTVVPVNFARAPYFHVYIGNHRIKVVANPYKSYAASVAKRVVMMLERYNPTVIIAKDFGYKAQMYLKQHKIRFEVMD